jgi:fructose-1,6-bisphosphatase/inositol monophosphatase family enzyme
VIKNLKERAGGHVYEGYYGTVINYEQELRVARQAARAASEVALRIQLAGFDTESKSDESPVTIADRECEKTILRILAETFPEDGFLGEEGAATESKNGRLWIIDPIDGTRDFVRHNPLWSHLIGLEVNGEVTVGVCLMPVLGQMYFAAKGLGAYRDDTRIFASEKTALNESVLCANQLGGWSGHPLEAKLLPWCSQFWGVRSLGGCLDAMLVASGKAEVWIEPKLQAWDMAGPRVILEEAGARFWNLDGGSSIYTKNVCAFAPGLEPGIRQFLAG